MPGKDWNKVKEIFHEALRLAGDERERYLDRACAGNIDLRIEVESLLISITEAESFLEQPAVAQLPETDGTRLKDGQQISHYKIVSHIATGGMGEVYLAEDQRLRRQVALKVLPEHLLADRERLRRFQREADAVSALNHPNILTIFEFDVENNIHLFASEYVKGETLRRRLEHGRLAVRDALDIAVQVASALQAAHNAGVVHRDIKPENIMIRDDGYVKVLDFGLAKITPQLFADSNAETQIRFSRPGMILGTVTYMSPEQARARHIDGRSDIFSLGIMLYEMLTGRPPFAGDTAADVIAAIIQFDAPPVSSISPDVPVELDAVIEKALSKKPADRYQTAGEMLTEIKTVLRRIEFDAEFKRQQRNSNGSGRSALESQAPAPIDDAGRDSFIDERNALVGRDTEIKDVTRLLRRSDVRLVTLTGIGGTGKTRLARAVADRLHHEFPGGSAFVELSCVRDPGLVTSSIAQSLGIPEIGGDDVVQNIKNELHDRPVLLILDNFEQVIDSATQIADLLEDLPGSKVLTTSRELLHLSAEVEYAVPPLAVPSIEDTPTADEVRRFESVLLFERRARDANPEFSLTDENAADVAEICARLDGLPLAIELAAARARILSPAEILSRLDDRLSLLTGGSRDLPQRQQTVRGAIGWSYDLLTDDEKEVFRRLAVFAGGFTHLAAESVLSRSGFRTKSPDKDFRGTESASSRSIDLLDPITSLAEKSLLVSMGRLNGERRFGFLGIVREYALGALRETDDENPTHRAHAEYFLELAETAEPHLKAADSAEWFHRLEEEHGNIRAALGWAVTNAPNTAARLAAAIRHLWTVHGHLHEGRHWSGEILARNSNIPNDIRWKILTGYGNLSQFQGDLEKAWEVYEESLEVSKRSGNKRQIAQSLRGLAALAYMQSDFAAALKFIEEAMEYSRAVGDKFGIGAAYGRLGDIASAEGNFAGARTLTGEALRIYRELGYKEGISAKLNNLGAAAFAQGEYEAARQYFDEALAAATEVGEKINTRLIFDGFAALAAEDGDFRRAAQLSGFAESLGASIGYAPEPAELRFREAYVSKVRAALGDAEFDAARNTGLKFTLDEATKLTRGSDEINKTRLRNNAHPTADPIAHDTKSLSLNESTTSLSPGLTSNKKWLIAALLTAIAATAGIAYWLFYSGSKQIDSIAVMPFVNESGNVDVEYLSDGMTEALIDSLSQLQNLNVKARSSVFRYKGKDIDPQKIGQELNVQALLTGRIVQRGDNLTLSWDLVDAATETHLAGGQYNRKLTDLAALQSEIARDVSRKLGARLSGMDKQKLAKNPTADPDAFQNYLRGRYQLNRLTDDGFKKAADLFQLAIERDPQFALAHAGLAEAYNNLGVFNVMAPRDVFPLSKSAASTALALDPDLGRAHAELAVIKTSYEWDWKGAEDNFSRAIELNPNDSESRLQYAFFLAFRGEFERAEAEMKRAIEIDPTSPAKIASLAQIYYFARRYDETINQANVALGMDPNLGFAHWTLGLAYIEKGSFDLAIPALQKSIVLSGDSPDEPASLAIAYARAGRKDEARKILAELEKRQYGYRSPALFAMVYASLGERDMALALLDKAVEERSIILAGLAVDPLFDALRDDPRFIEIVRVVGVAK